MYFFLWGVCACTYLVLSVAEMSGSSGENLIPEECIPLSLCFLPILLKHFCLNCESHFKHVWLDLFPKVCMLKSRGVCWVFPGNLSAYTKPIKTSVSLSWIRPNLTPGSGMSVERDVQSGTGWRSPLLAQTHNHGQVVCHWNIYCFLDPSLVFNSISQLREDWDSKN